MTNHAMALPCRLALTGLLLILPAMPQSADKFESPEALPEIHCDNFNMQQMTILTTHQKACIWSQNLVTWTAIFGAGISSGISQLRRTPAEWPLGAAGFGQRYGTAYAQSMAKSTGEFLASFFSLEDPRDPPPDNPVCGHTHSTAGSHIPARIGHALVHAVWVHHENCADGVAWSHFAGAAASGFVGMAWTPGPENTIQAALGRSGTAMAGYFGGALFKEFEPNLVSGLSHLFGQHNGRHK